MPDGEMKVLSLELIEQGRLLRDYDAKLRAAQLALVRYRRLHGPAGAGAKATVTLKVTLTADKKTVELYEVSAALSASLPARPVTITHAWEGTHPDDGKPCTLVLPTGSAEEREQQRVLCTDDGRLPGERPEARVDEALVEDVE